MTFDNQVAVVTGGTSGIGNATCVKLKEEGATVYNLDINGNNAEGIVFIKCDVRNYEEVKMLCNISTTRKVKLICCLLMPAFICLETLKTPT